MELHNNRFSHPPSRVMSGESENAMKKELAKLQKEYNELHERLGYVYNETTIRAINNRLDAIVEKMNKILAK